MQVVYKDICNIIRKASKKIFIIALFFNFSQLFKRGTVPFPNLCKPLAEIRNSFKGRIYFFKDYYVLGTKNRQNWDKFKVKTFLLEIAMFLGRKIDQIGTNPKL